MADMASMQAMQFMQMHDAMTRQHRVGAPVETMPKGTLPGGSLIIADVFSPSKAEDQFSHGEMVKMAATQNGFQGPTFTLASQVDMQRGMQTNRAEQGFFDPQATPEQTRANLATVASNSALTLLQGQTRMIEGATASGAKNSVLNMSSGGSHAATTARLYFSAAAAWDPKAEPEVKAGALTMTNNLAAAYGLSPDKLTSSDPKVSGPERARLQSALMNGVKSSVEGNCEVELAKKQYTTAVGRFESNRNSVVVASGNEGGILGEMVKDAHGNTPRNVPSNFATNYLDTPEATMVGATRWFDGKNGLNEQVAGYSSTNAGVDVYASGSLSTEGNGNANAHGTSFAAPRVAATMATLHRLNPNMTSSQVEHLMKQSLTHRLNSNGSEVSVLDFQKSSDANVGRSPR